MIPCVFYNSHAATSFILLQKTDNTKLCAGFAFEKYVVDNISHFFDRKLLSRILCDGILMCFTVLVCNHLILFVLLCYEETVLLHLVLFVYFPNLSSYFLFQVVYLILGCCFKCFLPGTFGFFPFLPSVLFSSSLWYIFFFLKVNIILLC